MERDFCEWYKVMAFSEASAQLTVEFQEIKSTHLACESAFITQYTVNLGRNCRPVTFTQDVLPREDMPFRKHLFFVDGSRMLIGIAEGNRGLNGF
jgi:hypothetical protein